MYPEDFKAPLLHGEEPGRIGVRALLEELTRELGAVPQAVGDPAGHGAAQNGTALAKEARLGRQLLLAGSGRPGAAGGADPQHVQLAHRAVDAAGPCGHGATG